MPLTPGLTSSLRQSGFAALDQSNPETESEDDDIDIPEFTGKPLLKVENEDGSITVSIDGKPVFGDDDDAEKAKEWFRNLVDDIDGMELTRIAEDLLRGIQDDLDSRIDWVEDRAQGIRLLGLKLENSSTNGTSDGAPVEGMSRVRHPLLMEAVVRFQSNANGEMMPADGPVKVRVDMNGSTIETDELAQDLEADLNHYLTAVATEYYPDTDRMHFMLGFGGTAFKKIYFCPERGRPVIESVDAEDLIVNNAATTLENARRITHRVMMRPNQVRRMQILGVYRDVDLITPSPIQPDAAQQEKAAQQGVSTDAFNPEDRDREIYECYCEIDIRGFEHKHKGKETGLEIPYRVTIDVSSREILSVIRNYDEPTGEEGDVLPKARKNFVKYSFVPALGFYDVGLLHLLGNTTTAVTALWREMLDAGMFANFPGALIADTGARQNTNMFRVPPGGAALVKTGGMPINQAVMPLPYKEPGPAMFNLVQSMVETGQRIGGTAELAVGEGRQDAPVGTTLAMIDQATKTQASVHKRMHRAQAEEFQLLVRTFKEHPESFLAHVEDAGKKWTEDRFVQALNAYQLVPQADPNTSSMMQRQMKVMGIKELQSGNPSLYDPVAIDIACAKAMGWSNPEQFMVPEDKRAQMPPEMQAQVATLKIQKQEADAKMLSAQSQMLKAKKDGQDMSGQPQPDPGQMAELHVKSKEIDSKAMEAQIDATNRQRDRESRERLAAVRLAEKMAENPMGLGVVNKMIDPGMLQRLEDNEKPVPGSEGAY
jgi:hypothetical protein